MEAIVPHIGLSRSEQHPGPCVVTVRSAEGHQVLQEVVDGVPEFRVF